jgi:hypothetical protein
MRSVKVPRTLWKTALVAMICASVCCSGCGNHVIVLPQGEPVRLRETIPNAKVWVADKAGREVEATVDLPEGWYCLPDSK